MTGCLQVLLPRQRRTPPPPLSCSFPHPAHMVEPNTCRASALCFLADALSGHILQRSSQGRYGNESLQLPCPLRLAVTRHSRCFSFLLGCFEV